MTSATPRPLDGRSPSIPDGNHSGILIVDDDPTFRAELRSLLEAQGYQLFEASTGDEALDVLCDQAIQVLVTDLTMPGLNGFELLRMLKGRPSHTGAVLVAVTAKYAIDIPLKDVLSSLGAHIVVAKSDMVALVTAIRGTRPTVGVRVVPAS